MLGEQAVVLLGNVSADADGIQAVQARLLTALAATVTQDAIVADQQHVRNELFVAAILLGLTAIQIDEARRRGQRRKIFVDVEIDSLKDAQLFKQRPFKTKHSFFGR